MPATQVGLLLAFLVLVDAHSEDVEWADCTCEPGARAFESFHIHVLFYPDPAPRGGNRTHHGGRRPHDPAAGGNNTHSSQFAKSLRKAFIEYFKITDCDMSLRGNYTTLCAFPVDDTGGSPTTGDFIVGAPFVAPNFAFFLPVDRYADAFPWMMANRGDLDFIMHPNTCGFECSAQDHVLWSVWGGNKWPVRFQLPGKV